MLWARVMRGRSSRPKSVAPLAANSWFAFGCPKGSHNPMTILPAAELGQVGLARLGIGPRGADLQNHVGGEDLVARGDDLGPFVDIMGIRKPGSLARPGLARGLRFRPWPRPECWPE